MISVSFSICSFIYIIIFTFVYFSKTRINLIENKIYTCLLMTTVIGLSIDIIGYFCFNMIPIESFINIAISKIYLIYYFTWTNLIMMYILIISFKQKINNKISFNKIIKKIIIFYLLLCAIIISLPVYISKSSSSMYSYGPAVNFIYLISTICVIIMLLSVFINVKNIRRKEYIPLLAFIIFGSIVLVVQHQYPDLLLLITCHSIVTALMYFTIENPDMQMVDELNKNRKLTEQNFEEKSNFLFKISQDLKYPLKEIMKLSQNIIDKTDIEENAKKINLNSKQLYTYVNGALDVSQIDIKNLKVIESTYNAVNFFEEIKKRTETEIKNKNSNIEFRTNITNSLPTYLCGDNVKLKQIILSTLFNSIRHTKHGFIEFSVNSITKYGVCRLLIEITDCGGGMSLDKINNILNINEELTNSDIDKIDKLNIDLALVHKMVKVLNGNFIIKSEEGNGTNFLVIIDQVIDNEKNINKDDSISKKLINHDNILLISDDKELSDKIINKIERVTISLFVKDAIDKISDKTKCILIDNNLKEKSGIEVLKELNTKIPCILLLNDKEKFLSNHYIEDGFKDFMLKEYIEDEINKIKKYL